MMGITMRNDSISWEDTKKIPIQSATWKMNSPQSEYTQEKYWKTDSVGCAGANAMSERWYKQLK